MSPPDDAATPERGLDDGLERARRPDASNVVHSDVGWAYEVGTIAFCVAAVAVPVWPGIHTIDSQAMLRSALDHQISDWYAPFHASALGAMFRLGHQAGLALVVATAAFAVALVSCYRLALGRRPACVATVLTVMWPPVYGMLGWVGRDVWFSAELLAVVACLGWARRCNRHRRHLHALAFALSLLALDARQNGVYVIAMVVVAVALERVVRPLGLGTIIAIGALGLVAMPIGYVAVAQAQRLVVREDANPEFVLYHYDLAGISLATDEVVFPRSVFPSQELDDIRSWWDVRGLRSPEYGSPPDGAPNGLRGYYHSDDGGITARAHRDAIRDHTAAYLLVRTRQYLAQLGVTRPAMSTYFTRSDELDWAQSSRLRQTWPAASDARARVLGWTTRDLGDGRIIHAPWAYLIGLAAAVVLMVRSGVHGRLGVVIGAGTACAQVLIWVSTPVANYRLQFPFVVLGIVCVVLAVAANASAPSEGATGTEDDR